MVKHTALSNPQKLIKPFNMLSLNVLNETNPLKAVVLGIVKVIPIRHQKIAMILVALNMFFKALILGKRYDE